MSTGILASDVLAHLPQPVVVFVPGSLSVKWLNARACDWFRAAPHPDKTLPELAPGLGQLVDELATLDGADTVRGQGLWLRLGDGTERACDYTVFSCEAGLALMLAGSETVLPEAGETGAAAPVAMLGRMLAHELKNPLAGIHGAAQLLESALEAEQDKELTALIRSEVGRIGRLVDEMENFAGTTDQSHEKLNVHSVLRRALLLFQTQENDGIVYVENYDPSLPDMYGHADRLMQVFVNLLANATQAIRSTGIGGRVEIQTRYRTGVHRRTESGARRALPLEIRIRDDGPGIPEHLKDIIFQPFVTSKANGHGLGLALVAKIVREHGGLIEHQSRPGKTVFSILLPIDPKHEEEER